jgi:hypothetical protein
VASHQAITEPRAILIVVTILKSRILVAGIVAFGATDLEELTGAVAGSCVAFHCDFDLLWETLVLAWKIFREVLSRMGKGLEGGGWLTPGVPSVVTSPSTADVVLVGAPRAVATRRETGRIYCYMVRELWQTDGKELVGSTSC